MENFIEWIFDTKAGKFVFIMAFDIIVLGFISSVTTMGFGPMMVGGFAGAVLLSVFDNNKRWF